MARVLVVGESWFTYTVHQKGFDAFYTSAYEEGGGAFLDALRRKGHEVTYVPSHEIHARVPSTAEGVDAFDVVVISDVGANSFQLAPATFERSEPLPDKTELLRDFTARGGGLLMVGGYLTFSGIDAKARWGRTPLAAALPVQVLDRDDRVELPAGASPAVVADHDVLRSLPRAWPALLGLNEVVPSAGATTLVECGGYPLLVVGGFERGRSAAFTSDVAPHWAPPPFLEWEGYATLWDQLVRWLAGESA
jgi:uncharacterized membrane protein